MAEKPSLDEAAIRAMARDGDAEGQFQMRFIYLHGQSVENNESEGIELWRKTAAQGHRRAQALLADIEEN